ncbi:MAG: VOC family protein [Myxococcales bacterium]|nr:VOC family protein [Myxococcales bacterium]
MRAPRTLQGRFLVALAIGFVAAHSARAASDAPRARSVLRVGVTVESVERSRAFFRDVLDFEPVSEREVAGDAYEHLTGVFGARARIVEMRLGDEVLELTEFLSAGGRPIAPDARSNDRSFQHIAIIVRDMREAYARLRSHGVRHASTGPQRLPDWNPAAGGIEAFYFLDPDGHVLEILAFPPGKGREKWHRPTTRLFLGIDHTAIVVGDTDRSLALYRDGLGMRVIGESENHGAEQEHLNNVFGARLRITTLSAGEGPSVELLEYLSPQGGRPMPADSNARDLWHWHVDVQVADADGLTRSARAKGAAWISPGALPLPDDLDRGARGAVIQDSDGHVLRLLQP